MSADARFFRPRPAHLLVRHAHQTTQWRRRVLREIRVPVREVATEVSSQQQQGEHREREDGPCFVVNALGLRTQQPRDQRQHCERSPCEPVRLHRRAIEAALAGMQIAERRGADGGNPAEEPHRAHGRREVGEASASRSHLEHHRQQQDADRKVQQQNVKTAEEIEELRHGLSALSLTRESLVRPRPRRP